MTGTAPIVVIGAGQAGQQICDSLRKGGYDGHLMLIGDEASLPYQRPPLSKKFLTGSLQAERLLLRPASYYQQLKVDVHLNARVVSIDRGACRVRLASGEALTYSGLALATGTRIRPMVCRARHKRPSITYAAWPMASDLPRRSPARAAWR